MSSDLQHFFQDDSRVTAPFKPDVLQDIITTYPNIGATDHTLDANLPPLRRPLSDNLSEIPRANLGTLDVLPVELLHSLLLEVDLGTVTNFCLVNRRAKEVADSLPQFEAISAHANEALRCISGVEASHLFTCQSLYDHLCEPNCGECGDFGGYLYILGCKRVCFNCFIDDYRYLPLPFGEVMRRFRLPRKVAESLPHMRSMPGTYSPKRKKSSQRFTLVSYEDARRAAVAFHGSEAAMVQHLSDAACQIFSLSPRAPFHPDGRLSEKEANNVYSDLLPRRDGQVEDVIGSGMEDLLCFVAIVRTPWLNKKSRRPEWGFHCKACQYFRLNGDREPSRRKFMVHSFEEHIRQEGDVREDVVEDVVNESRLGMLKYYHAPKRAAVARM